MAKNVVSVSSAPKPDRKATIRWDTNGVKLSGDLDAISMDKVVRVLLEGKVCGFSRQEYGSDMTIDLRLLRVESVKDDTGEEDEPSMATLVGKMGKPRKKE